MRVRTPRARLSTALAAWHLSVGLASSVLLAGCSDALHSPQAAEGASEPRPGGALKLASIGDIRSLDPAASSDALSSVVVHMLFAGLVDFDPSGNVVDELARSHEVSPDGLTVTFHLREGVRFHDGAELTARDVKRSVERALHPDTPNPFASFFDHLEGFDDYQAKKAADLRGIQVGGRYTVVVRLSARDAMILPMFALHSLRPVCAGAGDRYRDDWAPCGAGPFRLLPGGWERGRSVTVVRNPDYYQRGLPRLDAVIFQYVMPSLGQRFKFESGELDVMRDFTQSDLSRFLGDPRWQPLDTKEPPRAIYGEAMNTEIAPFDNVEIRRAVASAIDREEFRVLRPGSILPTGKAVPESVPGYSKDVAGQTFDYAAALEHMKKAGYPFDPATGKGGWPHSIPYLAYRPGFSGDASALVLQQQLARIGLRLDVRLVSFATYLTLSQRRRGVAMSTQAWTLDYPEAFDFYEPLFSSRIISDENCSNAAFFKNAELDELLTKARAEFDPAVRQGYYDRAQAIITDQAPWAMTHSYTWHVIEQPYVKALTSHATWTYDVRNTWIDRAKSALAQRAGVFGELLGVLPRVERRRARPEPRSARR